MSQDPNAGLGSPELQPEMQPIEVESESTASQQPAGYYAPAGYVPPAPEPSPAQGLRWAILGVAAAVAVTAGVWYALTPPAPTPLVPVVDTPVKVEEAVPAPSGAADVKATEFLKGVLGAKTTEIARATPIAASANDSTAETQLQAINAAALMAIGQTAPEIAKEISSGRRLLYPIRQGDDVTELTTKLHVTLFVDGADLGNVYRGAGVILVPLTPGQPSLLKLVPTVNQGSSGVSVGLYLPTGEVWRSRILAVGESDQRQITVP